MYSLINEHVQTISPFSEEELQAFNAAFETRYFPKKTMLLREGEVCNFEGFINKGCIRSYFVNENGAEVTLQFAIEGWWVSDICSFQERKPSRMFIETLEECEVLMLSPDAKEHLLKEIPVLEHMFRILIQRNLSRLQERFFQAVAATATEKYLDFLERYPTIPQRVAQHYIASYLGFTPEFLSKIRKRLSEK